MNIIYNEYVPLGVYSPSRSYKHYLQVCTNDTIKIMTLQSISLLLWVMRSCILTKCFSSLYGFNTDSN